MRVVAYVSNRVDASPSHLFAQPGTEPSMYGGLLVGGVVVVGVLVGFYALRRRAWYDPGTLIEKGSGPLA